MSRERVFRAINLEEPDAVPLFDFLYEHRSFENILGREVPSVTPEVVVEGHKALGLDLICSGAGAPEGWANRRITPATEMDEWGIKYRLTSEFRALPWYLEGPIKTPEDLEEYEMPDPYAPGRLKGLKAVLRMVGNEMAVACPFPIGGPFMATFFLAGFDAFLKTLVTNPRFSKRLLELQTWYCIEIEKQYLDAGVEIIFINDDLGDVHGPFLAPKLFREQVLPHLERLTQTLKQRGAKVLLHCDGNVNLIMDDLVGMGIDGFHPMERKSQMDIAEMKRKYGDKICLIGNVDASILLPLGTYEEITQQVKECIRIAAPDGGYIQVSQETGLGFYLKQQVSIGDTRLGADLNKGIKD